MNDAASLSLLPVTSALRERVQAIKQDWRRGAPPDARAALRRDPELLASKAALLELAYEEYYLRLEAGEDVDPDAFCETFPTFRSSVRRQLHFDSLFCHIPAAPGRPTLPPEGWVAPGTALGDLTLLRELGRGSFAQVFLALEHSAGDRPVAVKLSLGGGAEARTLGRLNHPHVVPVLSCRKDEATGLTMVCMPFLGSATLEDVRDWASAAPAPRRAALVLDAVRAAQLADDPPAAGGAADPCLLRESFTAGVMHLGAQLAEALMFVHGEGVVHRDLKPSNVLLGPDGCPRLVDFNLAADCRVPEAPVGGSLAYAAPELIRAMVEDGDAESAPDGRADLFSLGVILYEMLTGAHPFGPAPDRLKPMELGRWFLERQRRVWAECTSDIAPALRAVNGLDRPTARLLTRCLAPDRANRPADAAEVAAGLRGHTARRRVRRRRRWISLACLSALAVGALAWAAAGGTTRGQRSAYDLGRTYFAAGDFAEAEASFARAREENPDDVRARFAHACTLIKRAELDGAQLATVHLGEAARILQEIPGGDPREGLACLAMQYCYGRLKDMPATLHYAERAEQVGSRGTALLNNRAYIYIRTNELAKAAADLAGIPPRDRKLPAVCWNRAHRACKERRQNPYTFLEDSALEDVGRAVAGMKYGPALFELAADLHALAAADDCRRRAQLSGTSIGPGAALAPVVAGLAALQDSHWQWAIGYLSRARACGLEANYPPLQDPLWQPARGRSDFKSLPPTAAAPPAAVAEALPLIDPIADLPD